MPSDTRQNGNTAGSDYASVWVIPAALRQLAEGGDAELVKEVIAIFQDDTASRLEVLGKALDDADFETVRVEAHTIKGGASQIGANRVAGFCQQLELQAKTAAPSDLRILFGKVRESFDEICGVITAHQQASDDPFPG